MSSPFFTKNIGAIYSDTFALSSVDPNGRLRGILSDL
jgi:hypothetical protein